MAFYPYNLPHFEISPAMGGAFWPDPENKYKVNGLI